MIEKGGCVKDENHCLIYEYDKKFSKNTSTSEKSIYIYIFVVDPFNKFLSLNIYI